MKKILINLSLCMIICMTSISTVTAQEISQKELEVFSNENLSSVKKSAAKYLKKMESPLLKSVVTQMVEGKYQTNDRLRNYECYLSPKELAIRQKTSPYSQYENPTGINL